MHDPESPDNYVNLNPTPPILPTAEIHTRQGQNGLAQKLILDTLEIDCKISPCPGIGKSEVIVGGYLFGGVDGIKALEIAILTIGNLPSIQ